MKKIFLLLTAFVFIKASAQTADEVIQKYAAAVGGLENFKAIKTLKLSGSVSAQGNEFPLIVQIINGKAIRTDVTVMDKTIVSAYKDGAGWKINPFQGADAAVDVTGNELYDLRTQCFVASQLMDYKARGLSIELQGQEDVDGAKAYKIKLVADDKREYTYFIDATTYMVIKSINSTNMMGQDMLVETYYTDVKDFNGLKFSTSRTQKANGQALQDLHFDKIEINPAIDEKVFNK